MKHALFLISILCYVSVDVCGQKLRPAAIFQNGMVLQREQPVRVWGRACPGEVVQAYLLDEESMPYARPRRGLKLTRGRIVAAGATTATADGKFSLLLPAQKAGGPYELHVRSAGDAYIYKGVWLGEVWLCSGQSNMELRVRETSTARSDLAMADTLSRVHFYNMESLWPVYAEVWSEGRADSIDKGLFIRSAHWERCTAKRAAHFSAIGFTFARLLADSLGCHVGIISNAVGGSTTEGWIDSLSLHRGAPEILSNAWTENDSIMGWARCRAKFNLKAVGERGHSHPYAPSYLYYAAIAPIAGYTIKGVLWYQGESNAELISMHERLFPLLEQSWRTAWACHLLPFYTVQLSSISTRPTWPAFRDSQRRLANALPYTYMTVCADVGDSLNIHPTRKRIVGERLAHQVLHYAYNFKRVVPSGPEISNAVVNNRGSVVLSFTYAQGLHFATPVQKSWFELCDAQGTWHAARSVQIDSQSITIGTPLVPHPTAVRYAWSPFTRASLVNGADMPCSTFEVVVKSQPAKP